MSWERFHYTCRSVKRSLAQGLTCKASIEEAMACEIYSEFGVAIKPGSTADGILRKLQSFGDGELTAVERAFGIYGDLDFSTLLEKPQKLRRVVTYLVFLCGIFFVMSAVYLTFVVPQFEAMFEVTKLDATDKFLWFAKYWVPLAVVSIVLLVFSIILIRKIFSLFEFDDSVVGFYKILIPSDIIKNHEKILLLINLPSRGIGLVADGCSDSLSRHYGNTFLSDVEMGEDISSLIRVNLREMVDASEKFAYIIYTVVAIVILFGIFQFLSSIYSVIFIMGSVM